MVGQSDTNLIETSAKLFSTNVPPHKTQQTSEVNQFYGYGGKGGRVAKSKLAYCLSIKNLKWYLNLSFAKASMEMRYKDSSAGNS